MERKEQRKVCDVCGGAGQVSFFKGESRFLLSSEECEQCAGIGYELEQHPESEDSVRITRKIEKAAKGKK